MHGANISNWSYVMSIGACTSIGTTLTIITSDAYQVTMSTDLIKMVKLVCC